MGPSPRIAASHRVVRNALFAAVLAGFVAPFVAAGGSPVQAQTAASPYADPLALDIFKQLIEINTVDSVGNVTTAAEAMAKRLLDAGFPAADVAVLGPNDRKKNLVVRLHGSGKRKPLLLIGHLDVVAARREDWSTDPFKFVEKDGYYYGRGTVDMKSGDAIMMRTLIRLKQENVHLNRDVILALTADEEGGDSNGIDWLMRHHRELIDAQFVINHDDVSVVTEHDKPVFFKLDATEKVYADYQLTVTNPGGHSSLPVPDNAIYSLSAGLTRVAQYKFPFELNAVTRSYYERMSAIETGERATDMRAILRQTPDSEAIERLSRDSTDNATMRTTCVATRLDAGQANNALPQRAQAVVNCRILPGHSPEEVRQTLIAVLADPGIAVRFFDETGRVVDKASDDKGFAPPPLSPEILLPLDKLVDQMWPGLKVVPTMDDGSSDAVYTMAAGLPTYTIAGIAANRGDMRMHGRDERLGAASFYKGNEFFYRYIRTLTTH